MLISKTLSGSRITGTKGLSKAEDTMQQLSRFVPTNMIEQYDLVNEQGQELGQVQNFVIDMVAGRIAFVIVAFEDFLGISDKWFAMPWEIMASSPETRKFVVDMPKSALAAAPSMKKDKWTEEINSDWLAECYIHYGLSPYWDGRTFSEEQKKRSAYAVWEREGWLMPFGSRKGGLPAETRNTISVQNEF
jgi:sporulation protein YlmC with PRC-barrel domain